MQTAVGYHRAGIRLEGILRRDIETAHITEDPGAQVQLALDHMFKTLRVAGADFRNMVSMN